jgi:hypothetical protein
MYTSRNKIIVAVCKIIIIYIFQKREEKKDRKKKQKSVLAPVASAMVLSTKFSNISRSNGSVVILPTWSRKWCTQVQTLLWSLFYQAVVVILLSLESM